VSEALAAARAALADERAWVVGGAIRDRLLDRPVADIDLAIDGDPAAAARAVARAGGGITFPLSETFGAWRAIGPENAWNVDIATLQGETIEADLARRDFTVNAIAEPLAGGAPIDPFGGAVDVAARRLRMVAAGAFDDDPLRVVRLARFACELGLTADEPTIAAALERVERLHDVATERIFAELRRIVVADQALAGLDLLARLDVTDVVLPEVTALRGVEQNPYHHLDVHDHTLAVLEEVIALERDPERVLGEHAPAVVACMRQPLADEMNRWGGLRFGALLHDIAKPQTRGVTSEGRVTFMGHDAEGAAVADAVLARLNASRRLRRHVGGLARHHLRLGFLVHKRPLSPRGVHDYLLACGEVVVDVTVLSVADRLATRGRNADAAIAAHLELAHELLGPALRWATEGPPEPLVRGDEIAHALGVAPGPLLGPMLAELAAAQFAGEIASRDEALALARSLHDKG